MTVIARRLVVTGLARIALGLGFAMAGAGVPAQADDAQDTAVYIVRLREAPAIEVAGRQDQRRRLTTARRFDARAEPVRSYAASLTEEHDRLLARIGAPDAKLYSYALAFNGFAARLTREQATQLAGEPGVVRITPDRARKLHSNASAAFLGLLDAGEGLRGSLGLKGEGVVIGIIDSGIAPGHPSFEDRVEKKKPRFCRSEWADSSLLGRWLCARFKKPRYSSLYSAPRDWHGRCEPGERFPASACNHKLIGARYYAEGFRQLYDMDANEFMSARDADGHGTHIASVAAGQPVMASLGGSEAARIAGIAPRARIAAYKACWLEPGESRATCAMSDLQRAIEDAIADGVDIISYAVGTSEGGPLDDDAQALLNASDVGVLPVVAAGNGGPGAGTIESPGSAPWVLTVAASSRSGARWDEVLRVTAPAGAVRDIAEKEAGFTPTLRAKGPVSGRLVAASDGTAPADDGCEQLANASEVKGRIALVARGTCEFAVKVENAEAAGAIAVIVYNNEAGAPLLMRGERGSVGIPAVMIGLDDGNFLVARLAAGDPVEVKLDAGLLARRDDAGNLMYGPSARGPNPITGDVLKPDVTAPGANILGAQTPDVANGVRGERFQYLSGTSMAVPQVAGVAALLKEAHPDWSPAAIRSALVTSARQDVLKQDGTTSADPFDFGGGHVAPNRAVAPGLVYEAGREDYDAWACGAGIPRISDEDCAALAEAGYPTAIDELNLPALAVSGIVTERSVRRRVTNVGETGTWQAQLEAPAGVTMSVEPQVLSLAAGETGEFTVSFTNLGDEDVLGYWSFGALTWAGDGGPVRSPVVVNPERLGFPSSVAASAAAGETTFEVQFGYDGTYHASTSALFAPLSFTGTVLDDPLGIYTILEDDAALPDHVRRFRIIVPPGTRYLRVALGATGGSGSDDLDLYLLCPERLCPDGSPGLGSMGGTSDEVIDLLDPAAGEYVVDVHGFQADLVDGTPFQVRAWMIGDGAGAGTLTASAPATTSVGASGDVTLSWEGLAPGEVYLGLVTHGDGEERELGETVVEIASE